MTELEEVLQAGPSAVEAVLSAAARPLAVSDSTKLHGLAEGAGFRANVAFREGDLVTGEAWARCAVALYDCLAADLSQPNSFDLSAMNLRVKAILALGPLAGDDRFDPNTVVDWVRAALAGSPEEAVYRSARFKTSLAEGQSPSALDGRELRMMKNRLGVLVRLADAVPLDSDLQRWLEVRDQLV